MATFIKIWKCYDGEKELGEISAKSDDDAKSQIKLRWPEAKEPKAELEEAFTEAKKKKKPYSSITITTGDPDLNIDHFNKMAGTDDVGLGTADVAADNTASDAGTECSGGLCESTELDEDRIFSTKIGDYIELPSIVHILDKHTVSEFISGLTPGEEFTVGYVRPIYFYKKLLDKFTLVKLTEFTGFTGIDYWDLSKNKVYAPSNREAKAGNQILNPDSSTKYKIHDGSDTAAATGTDWKNSEVKQARVAVGMQNKHKYYDNVNKTVKQDDHPIYKYDASGKIERDEHGNPIVTEVVTDLNTLLFYPKANSKPKVLYCIDWHDGKGFRPIRPSILKGALYDKVVELTQQGLLSNKLEAHEDMTDDEIKFVGNIMDKVDKVIEEDNKTDANKALSVGSPDDYDYSMYSVRALYTGNIYYLASNYETLGNKIAGASRLATESLHLDEAKRYVRRYYIKPQNIFCSNKADIIKALIDIDDQDCTVYTLNNLGDVKDVSRLTPKDIIYIYKDEILFDKNGVKVMDYDLYIKHEENRDSIDPDTVSDSRFEDVYSDRITDADLGDKDVNIKGHGNARKESLEMKESRKRLVEEFDKSIRLAARDAGRKAGVFFDEDNARLFRIIALPIGSLRTSFLTEIIDELEANKTLGAGKNIQVDLKSSAKYNELLVYLQGRVEYDSFSDHKLRLPALNRAAKAIIETLVMLDPDLNIRYSRAKLNNYVDDLEISRTGAEKDAEDAADRHAAAKPWLAEHISGIRFSIPVAKYNCDAFRNDEEGKFDNLDDSERNRKADQFVAKFKKLSDHFHAKFPNAPKSDTNGYVERVDTGADYNYTFWNLAATVDSDTIFGDNEEVMKLIADCRKISAGVKDRVKDFVPISDIRNSYSVDSYYFAVAILHLFKGDFNGYHGSTTKKAVTTKRLVRKPAAAKEPENDNPFDQHFDNVDLEGNPIKNESLLREARGSVCCICGEEYDGYGNNAEPYAHGRCCDACNLKFVVPARLNASKTEEDK